MKKFISMKKFIFMLTIVIILTAASVFAFQPAYIIPANITVRTQQGPRCSAYALSAALEVYGYDVDPVVLFGSLPEDGGGKGLAELLPVAERMIGTGIVARQLYTVDDIKRSVSADTPVWMKIYMDAASKIIVWDRLTFFQYFFGGGSSLQSHAVVVVGWAPDWLIYQDSYGPSWGANGRKTMTDRVRAFMAYAIICREVAR